MDLKPCPFCGGEAKFEELCRGYVYVVCEKCNASSDIVATDKEAAEKWNRRQRGRAEKQGAAAQGLTICHEEEATPYSDIFEIDAEIQSHSVVKQKYPERI